MQPSVWPQFSHSMCA
uniref:Uncharacterized protein n=1 Tax=Rhizophora mucronata TaxID=61149 RepID=A0A2P2QKC4_RHIMU